ncbi:hypothetical protein ACGF1Z_22855 [Streptomyces sp. NPDC048018]|uniref:nSTAND1 domain-containing NTPase n=1 Tax=Streptomyces sp. NPDC048018 TaxID=3365499 RepID=UPI00371443A6
MSTVDDDGEGRSEEADEEDPSSRSYASGRDMYVAEQGDVHLYIENPEGDREHRTVGPVTDDCPYPGLAPFTAGQADRFHGRRRLLTELGERLADCHADHRPLVVVAPSGAGKTSLLQAGLSQDLDRGRIPVPGSRHWPRLLLTPTAHPLRELTARLAELAGEADPTADWWTTDRAGFADRLRRTAEGSGRVLVVVDQAEELFTLCADEEERRAFVRILEWLADGAVALVVLSLRADFYARCAELPWLRAAVQDNQLLLPPMTRDELLDAIRLPARAAGLRLEPGLAEVLVADFGATHGFAEPGALPLLAHALRATWQNRQGRLLTVAGYTGTGGVAHALGNSADRVHDQLDPAGRGIARRLFLAMVTIGEDTADSRRRIRREHLLASFPDKAAAEAVLAAFTAKRLLVQERDTVSLTHEALLTAWQRLHDWINDDRPRNLVLQDLDTAARAWHATGREPDALHRGKRLDRALAAAADPPTEDPLRRDFLDASLRLRKRVVRDRRRVVAVVVALALVAAVTGVVAYRQSGSAQAEQRAALAARLVTRADSVRAVEPALAAQLNLVAHRLAPRRDTRLNLLVDGNAMLPRTFPAHRLMLYLTAYRPDGRLLATAGEDGTIRLWNTTDPTRPRPVGKPLEGSALATYLAFAPDGRTLAIGGYNTTAMLWDLADPARPVRLAPSLDGQGSRVQTVAFSPDGRLLAGNGPKGRILLWDLADRQRPTPLPRSLTGSTGFPLSLAFGPDGRTLTAAANDDTVRVWDLARPTSPPSVLRPPNPARRHYRTAYSPDGRTLVAANDARVWLWNLTDPARPALRRFSLPAVGDVTALAFSRDGQTLAVADAGRTIRLWNVTDPDAPKGRPAAPNAVDEVRGLAFSPDGRALVGGTDRGAVKVWSLPDRRLPVAAYDSRSLAFTRDGRTLATGERDGRVRLWSLADPARPRPVGTVDAAKGEVTTLAFGPDGRTLAVGSWDGKDRRAGLWDLGDPGRPRRIDERALDHSGPPPALGADGRTAAVVGEDGVHVWDLAGTAGPERADVLLKTGADGVGSLAVSSDGRVIAAGHDSGDFTLWDPAGSGPLVRATGVYPGGLAPQVVTFSSDGRALAKADRATLTAWDLSDRAEPAARGAVTGSSVVESLAFAPGADVLAEGNEDGTVRLADPADASALSRPLADGADEVTDLAFSPDGRLLAAAGVDQPVRLWSTDPDAAARWICRATGNALTPAQWARHVPGLPYDPPCEDRD